MRWPPKKEKMAPKHQCLFKSWINESINTTYIYGPRSVMNNINVVYISGVVSLFTKGTFFTVKKILLKYHGLI